MKVKAKNYLKDISSRQQRRLVRLEMSRNAVSSNIEGNHKANISGLNIIQESENNFEGLLESNVRHNLVGSDSYSDSNHASDIDLNTTFLSGSVEKNQLPKISVGVENNFTDELRKFFIKHHISQNAIGDLLKIMNKFGVYKHAKDPRTFMHTPKNISTKLSCIGDGKYFHFGIQKGIERNLQDFSLQSSSDILLNVNVDGLPLSKSSGSQFWPILGALSSKLDSKPFLIGLYHGFSKPQDANKFLQPFVEEMLNIQQKGFIYNEKAFNVKVNAFVCDAPARSFICGIKNHTGYFGCSKCITEGEFVDNRVVFPEVTAKLRTDESFFSRQDPEHHKSDSILENLNVGMVSQVILDPMHLLYLGIMRKLLNFWVKGKMNLRFNKTKFHIVEQRNKMLRSSICKEFTRLPRSLVEVDRWKATELRLFLLYTGVVVLKGCLSKEFFNHFLSLHVACRILSSRKCLYLIEFANQNLRYFVEKFPKLYGTQNVSYNVHSLIHLSDEVRNFGSLESFSAFKFENFMYELKKKLKIGGKPLVQIINRMSEIENLVENCYDHSPNIDTSRNCHFIKLKNFYISSKIPNNCVMLKNGKIAVIADIFENDEKVSFSYKYYRNSGDLFEVPCRSSLLGVYVVNETHLSELEFSDITEVETKFLKIKDHKDEQFILMELLHVNI